MHEDGIVHEGWMFKKGNTSRYSTKQKCIHYSTRYHYISAKTPNPLSLLSLYAQTQLSIPDSSYFQHLPPIPPTHIYFPPHASGRGRKRPCGRGFSCSMRRSTLSSTSTPNAQPRPPTCTSSNTATATAAAAAAAAMIVDTTAVAIELLQNKVRVQTTTTTVTSLTLGRKKVLSRA